MASLITRVTDMVGTLVFSNPEKHNALSYEMWRQIPQALAAFDADPRIRIVVLEGEGEEAFVSGSDVSQFDARRSSTEDQALYDDAVREAHLAPGRCSKPVLAKIRGICYGGGMGLAASCDIRMCSDNARFRIPAARLGLGYPVYGIARLLPLIGPQNTCDILMSARTLSASEALTMGFVARVIPKENFEAEVDAWISLVAGNAPLTVRAIKKALSSSASSEALLSDPSVAAAIADCFSSEDYHEGRKAFMEKRKPNFQGR